MKKSTIIRLFCVFILIMAVSIGGFSENAWAVRHIYETDPEDGTPVFWVDTTETTATIGVAGIKRMGVLPGEVIYYWAGAVYGRYVYGPYGNDSIEIITTNADISQPRPYNTYLAMRNLSPGESYELKLGYYWHGDGISFLLLVVEPWSPGWSGGGNYYPGVVTEFGYHANNYAKRIVYTEPRTPTAPTYDKIQMTGVEVNWDKNGNGTATTYRLYRALSEEGPWECIYTVLDGSTYQDPSLTQNTTYYYKVSSQVPGSEEKFSLVSQVTTHVDPAVAYAEAAKNSADAAMIASQKAEQATYEMVEKVTAMEEKIDELNKLVKDRQAPVIHEFRYSQDKIRVVRSNVVPFILTATDDKSDVLEYRYSVNGGEFTEWQSLITGVIDVNLGTTNGYKQILVEVKDGSGKVTSASTSIFKL